jgi:two-component system sensor histidine kinase YesM
MIFWNIRKKLFIIFMVISLIPVIVVAISSYRSYTTLVSKQISLLSTNTIDNSVERMDDIFQNIDRITLTFQQFSVRPGTFTVADQLNELNHKPDLSLYDLFSARQNMMFFFNNLLLSNSYLSGIYIFLPNGESISYGNGTDLALDYIPFEDEWYQQTLERKGGLYISEADNKDFIINSSPSISFSRALYDANTRELLGVLMLECDLSIFKELDKDIVPDITSIYLINSKGEILYDNTKTRVGENVPPSLMNLVNRSSEGIVEETNNGILTVVRPFQENDWKIVTSIYIQELYKQYGISEKLILYISITCAVIFILLSVVLSNLITKPVINLSKVMRTAKAYPLTPADNHLDRKDEIGVLYKEYNKMINDLEDYIRESYQNKLMTLDAQMKALEAQINSHFLYNTLESINSIAEIEEVENIAIMTKALGDMFRYSIKTDSELVTIEEELSHVNNYMSIQQIRYEGKINFETQIETGLQYIRILKLILQPIIENAIYHGFERTGKRGTITLKAYQAGKDIIFEIADDGIGIPQEQLFQIQSAFTKIPEFKELGQRDKQSIGLKNVHSRIALYYGAGYGLSLYSQKDSGTTVRITVPRII